MSHKRNASSLHAARTTISKVTCGRQQAGKSGPGWKDNFRAMQYRTLNLLELGTPYVGWFSGRATINEHENDPVLRKASGLADPSQSQLGWPGIHVRKMTSVTLWKDLRGRSPACWIRPARTQRRLLYCTHMQYDGAVPVFIQPRTHRGSGLTISEV